MAINQGLLTTHGHEETVAESAFVTQHLAADVFPSVTEMGMRIGALKGRTICRGATNLILDHGHSPHCDTAAWVVCLPERGMSLWDASD